MKNMTNGGGQDSSPIALVRYSAIALTTALMIGCGGSSGGGDSSSSGGTTTTVISIEYYSKPYKEIVSPKTGKIWLDRNIGASQVCTSKTDSDCYGDLYQWGREIDGHEKRTSATSNTVSDVTQLVGKKFIIGLSDWTNADEDGSQRQAQMTNNGNGYCPSDYRVPTKSEFQAELDMNSPFDDSNFNAFLKIPLAGYRERSDGAIKATGVEADFWVNDTNDTTNAYSVLISSGNLKSPQNANRTYGFSIRCIKD